MGRIMGRTSDWPSNARRKRAGLKWRPPPEPGRSSHVRERSGLAARAESLPRFPGAPGGRRPGGRLSKDLCAREFEALRSCFVAAAKKSLKGGS
ncbi:NADH dehydrogenase [ubiquinone] 1 alpha subcomplex assembly factor 8 isoform X1 [Fukomys damarensis]|uniref:NADH dehydrogenase [ubiquinone] 1 alpha subcomplex assembly factor 8 isoform X1 n=1 Tax=Fukomys damarensis TaxID=885580 RepID=UPI001455AF0F|nr:NADH dehydrogenase [ubiquinone] 1 alpha subcomplex assembly factor 8 isoform X1 [Fukomys damarensis]